MWQRIQTLYLAVPTVLLFILFFSDAYTVTAPDGMQYVTYLQLQKPYFAILLGILFAMTVLALITFKVRILQMRLATLSGLVALGMTGWLAYFYFTAPENVAFKWTVIFPLIAAICDFLARLFPGPADGRERLPHPRIAEAGPQKKEVNLVGPLLFISYFSAAFIGSGITANVSFPRQHSLPRTSSLAEQWKMPALFSSIRQVTSHRSPGRTVFLNLTSSMPR